MKKLLLIIFFVTGSYITVCGNYNAGLCCNSQLEVLNNSSTETGDDCCESFCPCFCCTKIPVQVQVNTSNTLSITEITIPYLPQKSISEHNKKHWQPPKL